MDIGILTYHRAHNYGAVLQAYGLKRYLEKSGYNVNLVDYFPYYHQQMYEIFPYGYFRRWGYKQKIRFCLEFPLLLRNKLKKRKLFNDFIDYYLKPDRTYISKCYDVLVYGSDQIWRYQSNPLYKGYNEVYFGSSHISARKRIAYSASMGKMDEFDDNHKFFNENLKNFDYISVREKDLISKIDSFYIGEVAETLDPVFLLSGDEWKSLAGENIICDKYILLYNLLNDSKLVTIARELSLEKGIKVVEITGSVKRKYKKDTKMWEIKMVNGPKEFLSLVMNAEDIITSSFHGVVFSILFQKSFFTFLPTNSTRVLSLLENLKLENRFIAQYNSNDITEIDYSNVNLLLFSLIDRSKEYLDKTMVKCSF